MLRPRVGLDGRTVTPMGREDASKMFGRLVEKLKKSKAGRSWWKKPKKGRRRSKHHPK